MASISLAPYFIRVKEVGGPYLTLGNFGQQEDLFRILRSFLQALSQNGQLDDNSQKYMEVSDLAFEDRIIHGILNTGDYGYEADLYDLDAEQVVYQRRSNDAELLPFYFFASIPSDRDEGILLLQRFGQFGIKHVLFEGFRGHMRSAAPDFRVEINPLVQTHFIRKAIENGKLKSLRFIQFGFPSDIANMVRDATHIERDYRMEFIIKAKRNRSLPEQIKNRILDFISNRRGLDSIIELNDYRFRYQNIKVEVNQRGRTRTIDLGNFAAMRAYHDISNEVTIGTNGHPEFNSINQIAKEIHRDLRRRLDEND